MIGNEKLGQFPHSDHRSYAHGRYIVPSLVRIGLDNLAVQRANQDRDHLFGLHGTFSSEINAWNIEDAEGLLLFNMLLCAHLRDFLIDQRPNFRDDRYTDYIESRSVEKVMRSIHQCITDIYFWGLKFSTPFPPGAMARHAKLAVRGKRARRVLCGWMTYWPETDLFLVNC